MISLTEIFAILFIHWVADFICQDEEWALGKSKNWNDLLAHTSIYSFIWFVVGILFDFCTNYDSTKEFSIYWVFVWKFVGITFIAHTITDYITSREVAKKFENKHLGSHVPNFGAFTLIGFDQLLHYIQLFTTYYLLKS